MSEPDGSQHQAHAQARLIRWVCALSAIAALSTWSFDHVQGLNTPWDDIGAPFIALVYALAAIMLHWRPAWLDPIVISALLPTCVYYLGVLYFTAGNLTPTGLYSMAANAQYMPLYYVGAFVALRRHAALMCWLNYAGVAGLYLVRYGWPGADQGATHNPNAHVWATLLISHPCYIVALHYITALKGRLRATELASHLSKERFLAMLSHEIRSPLQAMLGSIDLLAIKAHTPPEMRAIDRIRKAAGQLDTHLRDITEYTRLEHPNWRMQPQEVDLFPLAQDVCDSYQARAQAKAIELVLEQPQAIASLPPALTSDPARLRQILCNLVSNAIKYTRQGRITVRIEWDEPAQCVHLSVSDTGIGIAPSDQQRIFEPYVRLEVRLDLRPQDSPPAQPEGTGLGLAVVKRLVDRLGGSLHLYSEVNKGSTFTVTLPLQA